MAVSLASFPTALVRFVLSTTRVRPSRSFTKVFAPVCERRAERKGVGRTETTVPGARWEDNLEEVAVFARIIHFRIKPGTADEFRKVTEQKAIPWLQGHRAFHGMHLVQLSDSEVLALELWENRESADAAQAEGQRLAQQFLGHLLTALPSFHGGRVLTQAPGHEARRRPSWFTE